MRAISSLLVLAVISLALAAVSQTSSAAAPGPRRGPVTGGWSPIKNTSDPHVIEIAKFAVSEYNKESNAELELSRVIKGETQVVAGTNYRLDVEAKEGKVAKEYEAVVWEKEWEHFRKLTSFKQLD